jgi:hypothetical protein
MATTTPRKLAALVTAATIGLSVLLAATPATAAGGGGETVDVSIPPTGKITCTNQAKKPLGTNPTLKAGDRAICEVAGLNPNEKVAVTIDAQGRDLAQPTTNAKGGLTYHFKVPKGLSVGQHRLVFTGQKSKTTAVQAFRIAKPQGRGNPQAGGNSKAPSRLAFTGANILIPIAIGAALIATGAAVTTTTRRRRSPQ